MSRFATYLQWLEKDVANGLAFRTEREAMRIPSTKNIAFVGHATELEENDLQRRLQTVMAGYESGSFVVRLTDKAMKMQHRERMNKRKQDDEEVVDDGDDDDDGNDAKNVAWSDEETEQQKQPKKKKQKK
jgi:hypothetical protein